MDAECFPTNLIEDSCLFWHETEGNSLWICFTVKCTHTVVQNKSNVQKIGARRWRARREPRPRLMCMLFCWFVTCFSFISRPSPHVSLRSAVLGGVESRGVLRKISDMLEVILKRMDSLSKLDNSSSNTADARRLDELSSAINRYAGFQVNSASNWF